MCEGIQNRSRGRVEKGKTEVADGRESEDMKEEASWMARDASRCEREGERGAEEECKGEREGSRWSG